jgi:DNA-binding transcriptional ArsR family regulator
VPPDASSKVIFKLSNNHLAGNINIEPGALHVLSSVNGMSTVAEIAASLGEDAATVMHTLSALYELGVVEVLGIADVVEEANAARPLPALDDAFFSQLTRELTRAIGPLASFFVDDELAAMSARREGFPRDRAAELVERLSMSIRDETKRIQFQQALLPELRRLF